MAFDERASNQELYLNSVQPLVGAVFAKANVSCFAYGQTGSGKTFTMIGNVGACKGMGAKISGLYLLAAQDLFKMLRLVTQMISLFVKVYWV
jgi:kinesin family protein 2/24